MSTIRLSHPTGELSGTIRLDGSKSISNRILIIRALCEDDFVVHHLSTSDDTSTLSQLLVKQEEDGIYDVGHAGTTFRFLTAYLAIKEGSQTLTGSARMLQRPIGPLVKALRQLGCNIDYLGEDGYPPLRLHGVDRSQLSSTVSIDAGVSSQYMTALLLIAPSLPNGLELHLEGELVSESYLRLTLAVMNDFGVIATYHNNRISVSPQSYDPLPYTIEADWSAASYYYSLVALSKSSDIKLLGLSDSSFQGDADIVRYSKDFGVISRWSDQELSLKRSDQVDDLKENFLKMPDIAQTVATICAARSIHNEFSGLKTLRIKETDRIYAMDQELSKIGSGFALLRKTEEDEFYTVSPGTNFENGVPRFETYKDHRMAMCLAPLALLHPIEINQPEVVSKSYPHFWEDLKSLGFVIEKIN